MARTHAGSVTSTRDPQGLEEGAGREAHGDRGGTVVVVLGVVEHGPAAVAGEDRGKASVASAMFAQA